MSTADFTTVFVIILDCFPPRTGGACATVGTASEAFLAARGELHALRVIGDVGT